MKFKGCREGRHGACPGTDEIPYYDTEADQPIAEVERCECWCHVTVIPDPEPGETLYGSSSD